MCMHGNDVNFSFFLECRLHSFGLVGTGLRVGSSPGFPFGHISAASGSSSFSYSHFIVAHLIKTSLRKC